MYSTLLVKIFKCSIVASKPNHKRFLQMYFQMYFLKCITGAIGENFQMFHCCGGGKASKPNHQRELLVSLVGDQLGTGWWIIIVKSIQLNTHLHSIWVLDGSKPKMFHHPENKPINQEAHSLRPLTNQPNKWSYWLIKKKSVGFIEGQHYEGSQVYSTMFLSFSVLFFWDTVDKCCQTIYIHELSAAVREQLKCIVAYWPTVT